MIHVSLRFYLKLQLRTQTFFTVVFLNEYFFSILYQFQKIASFSFFQLVLFEFEYLFKIMLNYMYVTGMLAPHPHTIV